MIRVGVFGAAGRMGSEVCRAVEAAQDMNLIAAVDIKGGAGGVSGDRTLILDGGAEVAVDFTVAESAVENIEWCLSSRVHVVVGTTGISSEEIARIDGLAKESSANVLIAPNFAIGAILMMRFARQAAAWMPDAEVIELHHDGKLDSPSGTALRTADAIALGRRSAPGSKAKQKESKQTIAGARGALSEEVPIHSVRLPGLVAHQEVVFGGQGQTLSIRHDSIDRTSFMPGVLLAVRNVAKLPGLTIGLDAIIDEQSTGH